MVALSPSPRSSVLFTLLFVGYSHISSSQILSPWSRTRRNIMPVVNNNISYLKGHIHTQRYRRNEASSVVTITYKQQTRKRTENNDRKRIKEKREVHADMISCKHVSPHGLPARACSPSHHCVFLTASPAPPLRDSCPTPLSTSPPRPWGSLFPPWINTPPFVAGLLPLPSVHVLLLSFLDALFALCLRGDLFLGCALLPLQSAPP